MEWLVGEVFNQKPHRVRKKRKQFVCVVALFERKCEENTGETIFHKKYQQ